MTPGRTGPAADGALVETAGLTVEHPARGGSGWLGRRVRAVDGLDIRIGRGRVLGLIGESGSGKTTVGRALLGLVPPTRGRVSFDGVDVTRRSRSTMRRLSTRVQAIFQDTSGTLDPRMTIRGSLGEALRRRPDRGRGRGDRAAGLLSSVGLDAGLLDRYPHELSGGQRQRVGIARALAVEPEFVVCDEPTASLDVSVQAQVLNLLASLRHGLGLAYLFIGHDIAVVRYLSDEVAVMFAGRIVEQGPADEVCRRPRHPYTRALVTAVAGRPVADRAAGEPGPVATGGCRFRHRCALAAALEHPALCAEQEPPLRQAGTGHRAACHFLEAAEEVGGA
ncbi:MAG: ATP-binding cassette domain-containing protein [Micromonosporaceae bacterium]|nr:ATP-binding cassette domain-containing protein [Micromonosporaceae bacterium]